jgi:hypothetical protein
LAAIKAAFPASYNFFKKKSLGNIATQGPDNPGAGSAIVGKGGTSPQDHFIDAALLTAAL